MREYGGDIHYLYLESQTLPKKRFSFKVVFISHSHCLTTITFTLDIYLWRLVYYDGSVTIMWNLDVFINEFPLPCRRV